MRDLRVLGLRTPQSRGDRGGHMHVTARCGAAEDNLVGTVEACGIPGLEGFWRWTLARARPSGGVGDIGGSHRALCEEHGRGVNCLGFPGSLRTVNQDVTLRCAWGDT